MIAAALCTLAKLVMARRAGVLTGRQWWAAILHIIY